MNAVGGLGDNAIELFHLRGAANDAAEALLRLDLLAQKAIFGLQLQVAGHAFQQHLQLVEAEGFGDIVVGAILHGLHRGLHCAVAGHNDDDSLRTAFLDATKRVQTAGAGKAQIE